ncbi:MAG: DEAD/DEAH box helicase [Verrucomicrobia bacterium]|nr:DEAD/DEAH box helicase [Verrucomicrobiota bacterium]MCH8510762.1 DEAD/DEAH box helicase [Kiritimatiellia bacterium]
MEKKRFDELNLSPGILKAVAAMGFEEATPIQSATIPALMSGKDMVGQSQTGSGKTAAFAIPAIEGIDVTSKATQVLILCPTRELALQVAEETAKLAQGKKGVRELPIYGGQSYERQFRGLHQGAHIVIGTPGRVLDHLDRGSLKLDEIRTVILDEADRMLDMGFMDDIKSVLSRMPDSRQTVLFSATVPPPIAKLIKSFTRDPVWVHIESQELTAPEIEQVWYEVDRRSKLEVLCRLIDMEDIRYGIIFCATKMMVDDLVEHLSARGYLADKLHGDISQMMRERVMNRFRKRGFEFLVATDVAARGLDVKDIEVVFNYDLPNDGEDYVHRIGRTGRAGSKGKAITLVAGRELYRLQNIMRFTKAKIKRGRVPTVEQLEERRADLFFESLRGVLDAGDFKRHDALVDRLLEQGHSPTDIISALIDLADKASGKPVPEAIPEPQSARESARGGPKPPKKGGKKLRGPSEGGGDAHADMGPTRNIILNVGRSQRIKAGDILGVILGASKIPKEAVGYIELGPRESRVTLSAAHTDKALKKLNGIKFKGHELQVVEE